MLNIHKRESFGFCWDWLFNQHLIDLKRYVAEFYWPQDYQNVLYFFNKNPIQGKKILQDYLKTNAKKLKEVIMAFAYGKSKIVYIVGARDSGKTATAFKIAEDVNILTGRKIFYIAPTKINPKYLPSWCKHALSVHDAPRGCFGIVDEAAIQYAARESMSEENTDLGKLLAIARHKEMFLIFITQHSSMSDINISRLRDMVMWKMSNDYSIQERGTKQSKEHQFWAKAKNMMAPREKKQCLFEYPAQRRLIHFEHGLPDCWTDRLSKLWGAYDVRKSPVEKEKIENKKKQEVKVLKI